MSLPVYRDDPRPLYGTLPLKKYYRKEIEINDYRIDMITLI